PDAIRASIEESEVIADVIQYHHYPEPSIFNPTADVVIREKTQEQQLIDVTSVEMAKLQNEIALLRSKLVAQIKVRARLKAAFNVPSEVNPPRSKVTTTNPPATPF
ncbi:unnamed protein product, partial [Hymenolepis diminuta]